MPSVLDKISSDPSSKQVSTTPLVSGWTVTTRSDPPGQTLTDAYHMYHLAGLFEGEGCIVSYNGRLEVTLSNTEPEMVLKFHWRYPGNIQHVKPNGKNQQAWRWRVFGATALSFLKDIEPYLLFGKKDQALLAMKIRKETPGSMRDWMEQELKDLKRVNQGNWEVAESA